MSDFAMKLFAVIMIILIAVLLFSAVFFNATPTGKALWNSWFHAVQKADDATNYDTRKQVEDTCRSMISSYTSDKLTYEQYKDSEIAEEHGWAEQAKMRANKTASTYNNFIIKNSYVWSGNVPPDIYMTLDYID